MKFDSLLPELRKSRLSAGLGAAALALTLNCSLMPGKDDVVAMPAPTEDQIKNAAGSGVGWWKVESKTHRGSTWDVELVIGASVVQGSSGVATGGLHLGTIKLRIPDSNDYWNNFLSDDQNSSGVVLPFYVQQDGSIITMPERASFEFRSAAEFMNPNAL